MMGQKFASEYKENRYSSFVYKKRGVAFNCFL